VPLPHLCEINHDMRRPLTIVDLRVTHPSANMAVAKVDESDAVSGADHGAARVLLKAPVTGVKRPRLDSDSAGVLDPAHEPRFTPSTLRGAAGGPGEEHGSSSGEFGGASASQICAGEVKHRTRRDERDDIAAALLERPATELDVRVDGLGDSQADRPSSSSSGLGATGSGGASTSLKSDAEQTVWHVSRKSSATKCGAGDRGVARGAGAGDAAKGAGAGVPTPVDE